jgi:hypothetical protein
VCGFFRISPERSNIEKFHFLAEKFPASHSIVFSNFNKFFK